MQDTSLLYKFLGIARWKGLFSAFDRYTTSVGDGSIGTGAMLLSIACALTPLFITSFEQSLPISVRQDSPVDVPTLSFGVCAILAILM
ncbi:MAG: hypothetical protein KDD44_15090, partial [Bdellovibrionales bacterium]|nr:hypothetical protein [Bdellovibrionales bacterium]